MKKKNRYAPHSIDPVAVSNAVSIFFFCALCSFCRERLGWVRWNTQYMSTVCDNAGSGIRLSLSTVRVWCPTWHSEALRCERYRICDSPCNGNDYDDEFGSQSCLDLVGLLCPCLKRKLAFWETMPVVQGCDFVCHVSQLTILPVCNIKRNNK